MIKRFDQVLGRSIEKIYGQDRYAYSHSDLEDLYDLIEWSKRGGYQGSELLIYDFETGSVHTPFAKRRDVVYGDPAYVDGYLYFLQGDYAEKVVNLYRYLPETGPDLVTSLNIDEIELYNLQIIGSPLYIISQNSGEEFRCYYPEQMAFPLEPEESVLFIENGKVYIEKWIEEGWDHERDQATDEYQYYNRILVKDTEGRLLSSEIGSLNRFADGSWWIS